MGIEREDVVALHDAHLRLVAPERVVQRVEAGQRVHEVDLLGARPRVARPVCFVYGDAFERVLWTVWEDNWKYIIIVKMYTKIMSDRSWSVTLVWNALNC